MIFSKNNIFFIILKLSNIWKIKGGAGASSNLTLLGSAGSKIINNFYIVWNFCKNIKNIKIVKIFALWHRHLIFLIILKLSKILNFSTHMPRCRGVHCRPPVFIIFLQFSVFHFVSHTWSSVTSWWRDGCFDRAWFDFEEECPKTWRPGFQGPGTGCRGFDTPVGRWPGELLYIDVIVQSNFRLASVARFQNIFGLVYDEDEDDDDGDHDHFCFIAHYPPWCKNKNEEEDKLHITTKRLYIYL